MKKDIIEFIRTKDYKFIKSIGQGGTGKTVLLQDEILNEYFICKKYSPSYEEHKEIYFKNFVDEIRLLHLLFHKNVVRIFNYYLYPEKTTGYILMEYVNGLSISDYIQSNPDKLNSVFIQAIEGFQHLEGNNILHRDIRPENIMVSNDCVVKIIDFGFGKKINFDETYSNSISLNWRYSVPNDFQTRTYDFKTEIYFIGKLFEEIIYDNSLQNFSYQHVLLEMINPDWNKRISSFFEVNRTIITNNSKEIKFTQPEIHAYRVFADDICSLYSKIGHDAEYATNIDSIIKSLETIYNNSMLEDFIQNTSNLTNTFIKGPYYFFSKIFIKVSSLKKFIQLLNSVSADKRKIILNNLWQRFDKIDRYNAINLDRPDDDDLPF